MTTRIPVPPERLAWARERGGLESFALAGELEPAAVTPRKGAHE